MRRGLLFAAGVMVASMLLLLVLVDVRAVIAAIGQADWRYLAAASVALLAGTGAYALRWKLLLGGRASWANTLLASGLGHGLNLLLPLRLGEAARIVGLGRTERLPYSEVTSSVVVERLWEQGLRLAALAGAIAFGVGLQPSPAALAGGAAVLLGAALGMAWLRGKKSWVLASVPRWLARLPRLDETRVRAALGRLLAGLEQATRPRQLAHGGLTSLLAWCLFLGFHTLALLALRVTLPPMEILALALGALALVPPSAPTVPGVYHAALVVPLAVTGQPAALLTAYAVVLHALLMAWLLPLGLLGLARSGLSPRDVLPAAEPEPAR